MLIALFVELIITLNNSASYVQYITEGGQGEQDFWRKREGRGEPDKCMRCARLD